MFGFGVSARNIEIKARVSDLPRCRARVASLAPAPAEILAQTDTFFAVPRGRLKVRQFSDGSGELIFYERPDGAGPKGSSYSRCRCPEPRAVSAVLAHALGVRGVVEKRREVFMIGRSRIHLDEVRGLGTFLEIEVVLGEREDDAEGERVARELLAACGVPASDLVGRAYIDLLEDRGTAAALRGTS
jgi:predicted adenylyl cyclase CyaB